MYCQNLKTNNNKIFYDQSKSYFGWLLRINLGTRYGNIKNALEEPLQLMVERSIATLVPPQTIAAPQMPISHFIVRNSCKHELLTSEFVACAGKNHAIRHFWNPKQKNWGIQTVSSTSKFFG